MRRRSHRGTRTADTVMAGKVLVAVLAWTVVGVAGLASLFAIPALAHFIPLPHAIVDAVGVLRAELSGLTLGLVFVGWLLGVLAIFTLAALRRLWRRPVVLPLTKGPAGRGA